MSKKLVVTFVISDTKVVIESDSLLGILEDKLDTMDANWRIESAVEITEKMVPKVTKKKLDPKNDWKPEEPKSIAEGWGKAKIYDKHRRFSSRSTREENGKVK